MLIKHSALYFLGRLIPGLVSLGSLALFTRMMTPIEYGTYALVLTTVGIVNAVVFQWLNLGLGRFLPAAHLNPVPLLATTLTTFFLLMTVTAFAGTIVVMFVDQKLKLIAVIALVLIWAQAWFELNLKIVNVRLAATTYGAISSLKALLSVGLGSTFLYFGFGTFGVLAGLCAGFTLAAVPLLRQWRDIDFFASSRLLLIQFLQYGLPLTLTLMLTLVLDVSDRFLLNWKLGADAVGSYSSAYDLAQQSLGMLMGVVHLAAFPLVLRVFETDGAAAARSQIEKNGFFLLAVAVPATVGLACLSKNIGFVMLGSGFQQDASRIISVVALAILIGGIKSYYFDYSFQLGREAGGLAWAALGAAGVNLALNFYWIPIYGVLGSAYATLAGFSIGLLLSFLLGRRIFALPGFSREIWKIGLATSIMGAVLMLFCNGVGAVALLMHIFIGVLVYISLMILLNAGGTRSELRKIF